MCSESLSTFLGHHQMPRLTIFSNIVQATKSFHTGENFFQKGEEEKKQVSTFLSSEISFREVTF